MKKISNGCAALTIILASRCHDGSWIADGVAVVVADAVDQLGAGPVRQPRRRDGQAETGLQTLVHFVRLEE